MKKELRTNSLVRQPLKEKTFLKTGIKKQKENYMENGIDNIIGFRYEATGVFGYEFYNDREKLCSVSSLVVPSPTVMISGYGQEWEFEYRRGESVFPGTARNVYDIKTNRRIAIVAYKDSEKYVINNYYIMSCDSQGYKITCRNEIVAEITRFEGEHSWCPDSACYEYEAYFKVSLSQELDDEHKMLAMALPILRFGQ